MKNRKRTIRTRLAAACAALALLCAFGTAALAAPTGIAEPTTSLELLADSTIPVESQGALSTEETSLPQGAGTAKAASGPVTTAAANASIAWQNSPKWGTAVSSSHWIVPIKQQGAKGILQVNLGSDVEELVLVCSPGLGIQSDTDISGLTGAPWLSGDATNGYSLHYPVVNSGSGSILFDASVSETSNIVYPGLQLTVNLQAYDKQGNLLPGYGASAMFELDASLYAGLNVSVNVQKNTGNSNTIKLYSNKSQFSSIRDCVDTDILYVMANYVPNTSPGGTIVLPAGGWVELDFSKIQVSSSADRHQMVKPITDNAYKGMLGLLTVEKSLSSGTGSYNTTTHIYKSHDMRGIQLTVDENFYRSFPGEYNLHLTDPDFITVYNADGTRATHMYINNAGVDAAKIPLQTGVGANATISIQPFVTPPARVFAGVTASSTAATLHGHDSTFVQLLFANYIYNEHALQNGTISYELEFPAGVHPSIVKLPAVPSDSIGIRPGSDIKIYDVTSGALVGQQTFATAEKAILALDTAKITGRRLRVEVDYIGAAYGLLYNNSTAIDHHLDGDSHLFFYGTVDTSLAGSGITFLTDNVINAAGAATSTDQRSINVTRQRSQDIRPEGILHAIQSDGTYSPVGRDGNITIGETYAMELYASVASKYSNNLGASYDGNLDMDNPVVYLSVPPGVVSQTGDQNFTMADAITYLPSSAPGALQSVRTVTDAAGNVLEGHLGGCVVELRFNSVTAILQDYEPGGPLYPDVSTLEGYLANDTMGTAKTETVYLIAKFDTDISAFPNTLTAMPNAHTMGGASATYAGYDSSNVADDLAAFSPSGTYTGSDLVNQFGMEPHKASDKGNHVCNTASTGSGFSTVHVLWPETAAANAGVQLADGTRHSYNPTNGEGSVAALTAVTGNRFFITAQNLSTGATQDVLYYFRLPASSTHVSKVAASLVEDAASAGLNAKIEYALPGATPSHNDASGWGAPYEGTPYAIRITLPGLAAGKSYNATLEFTPVEIGGAAGKADGLLVGETRYDFGMVNGVQVQQVGGDARTAAYLLPGEAEVPPIITPAPNPGNGNNNSASGSPIAKTGDASPTAPFIALGTAALVALLGIGYINSRRKGEPKQ